MLSAVVWHSLFAVNIIFMQVQDCSNHHFLKKTLNSPIILKGTVYASYVVISTNCMLPTSSIKTLDNFLEFSKFRCSSFWLQNGSNLGQSNKYKYLSIIELADTFKAMFHRMWLVSKLLTLGITEPIYRLKPT